MRTNLKQQTTITSNIYDHFQYLVDYSPSDEVPREKRGFNSKGPQGSWGVVPWPLDIKGVPLKGNRPKDGCRPIIALD